MAMKFDELQELVRGHGLKYFVASDEPMLMLSAQGAAGSYQFVIALQIEGTFLQFRTVNFLQCSRKHPHLQLVLEVLGGINFVKRFVKLGWDESDGEIAVYGDVWIQDGTLTQDQFSRIVGNYFPVVDSSYARLTQTMETGEDPGEESVAKKLLDRIQGGGEGGPTEI